MNTKASSTSISSPKRQLIWNASHIDALTTEELMDVLRYTAKLAELYEAYILAKGVRYIREADDYIQTHKGPEYPLL